MNDNAVIIGGLQRSGTSLVRSILTSHPDLAIYPYDIPLWTHLYPKFKRFDFNNHDYSDKLVDEITAHPKFISSKMPEANTELKERLRSMDNVDFAAICEQFLQYYAELNGKNRWGLKTPHNEFFADEILNSFPESKMIHVIRDPRDVGASIQKKGWNAAKVTKHCWLWSESVKIASKNEKRYPGRYLAIKYEDLIYDAESITREMCDFLDLSYTETMLEMQKNDEWKGHNSSFKDMNSGISSKPIGRFRENLSSIDVNVYETLLKKQMKEFGYEPANIKLNKVQNLIFLRKILLEYPLTMAYEKMKGVFFRHI